MPRSRSSRSSGALASNTCRPSNRGARELNRPCASTVMMTGMPAAVTMAKSSSPCEGATWTMPVPSSVETKSPHEHGEGRRHVLVDSCRNSNTGAYFSPAKSVPLRVSTLRAPASSLAYAATRDSAMTYRWPSGSSSTA